MATEYKYTQTVQDPLAERLDHDVFLVNQKHLSLGKSKYHVYSESGQELFYVERPVMRLFGRRADITFYDREGAPAPLLTLKQDHGYEFRRREYTLVDEAGETIARLRRDNIKALFRRAWTIVLHADLAWPPSALDRVIATPPFHRRHHREDLPPGNFASTLPVLDRVFGTSGSS